MAGNHYGASVTELRSASFLPCLHVRGHCPLRRQEAVSLPYTGGSENTSMSSNQSYHVQLEPRPRGWSHSPAVAPPASILPPSRPVTCRPAAESCLPLPCHTEGVALAGNGENGREEEVGVRRGKGMGQSRGTRGGGHSPASRQSSRDFGQSPAVRRNPLRPSKDRGNARSAGAHYARELPNTTNCFRATG